MKLPLANLITKKEKVKKYKIRNYKYKLPLTQKGF